MHGERACDTQALLLTAGEGMGALVELVLHLIPQRTCAQSLLYKRIALVFALHKAVALRREQDVVANRLAKRRRLLEHHADGFAQIEKVFRTRVDVAAVIVNLACDLALGNLAVHEVQAAQEGGLATTRRADKRRNLPFLESERGLVQCLERIVGYRDVVRAQKWLGAFPCRSLRPRCDARHAIPLFSEGFLLLHHSLVSLLSKSLPTKRAIRLKARMHTMSTDAVPFEMASRSGTTPSELIFQIWTASVSAGRKMFHGHDGLERSKHVKSSTGAL